MSITLLYLRILMKISNLRYFIAFTISFKASKSSPNPKVECNFHSNYSHFIKELKRKFESILENYLTFW